MSERKTGLGSIRKLARAAAEAEDFDLGPPREAARAFKGLVEGPTDVSTPIEDFRQFLEGGGWQKLKAEDAIIAVSETALARDEAARKQQELEAEVARLLNVLNRVMVRASAIDERAIPKRRPLLGNTALVGTLSLLAGAGGGGKSALQLARAIALATGIDITGETVNEGPKRVLYFNFEDPLHEIQMRAAGICKAAGIPLPENLILVSGLELPFECLVVADEAGSVCVNEPVIRMFDALIRQHQVEVLMLDPFVRLHAVDENSNGKIDFVARQLVRMAARHQLASLLTHHVSKGAASNRTIEGASRGAGSLVDGVRNAEVMHRATPAEVDEMVKAQGEELYRVAGLDLSHWRFVYTHSAKVNYTPPVAGRRWFYLRSVQLLNGDDVVVVKPFILSQKVEVSAVFLLAEVAAKVDADTGGRGGNSVPITLADAAAYLVKQGKGKRTTLYGNLKKPFKGDKQLMLSDGVLVRLGTSNEQLTLHFNFDNRETGHD